MDKDRKKVPGSLPPEGSAQQEPKASTSSALDQSNEYLSEESSEREGSQNDELKVDRRHYESWLTKFSDLWRESHFPLDILVPSNMVHVIIGRGGSTIRQIAQTTKTKIDIHTSACAGCPETGITILGSTSTRRKDACMEIMIAIKAAGKHRNIGEIPLKILSPDNIFEEVIGHDGITMKRIMRESGSRITVSRFEDRENGWHVFTVEGSIENMSNAQALISAKLKNGYKEYLKAITAIYQPPITASGLYPAENVARRGMRGAGPVYASLIPSQLGYPPVDDKETTVMCIPNHFLRLLIGPKEMNIRSIAYLSGASIAIPPLVQDGGQYPQEDLRVIIVGGPEAQWKAQGLIHITAKADYFEAALTIERAVPSFVVKYVIGQKGENLRELQRITGANVSFPVKYPPPTLAKFTIINITGPFISVQNAQRLLRDMVQYGF